MDHYRSITSTLQLMALVVSMLCGGTALQLVSAGKPEIPDVTQIAGATQGAIKAGTKWWKSKTTWIIVALLMVVVLGVCIYFCATKSGEPGAQAGAGTAIGVALLVIGAIIYFYRRDIQKAYRDLTKKPSLVGPRQ
ncbi:shikimate dehydrogenase, putative [Babesia ovis]|uniref:Shikimate dehydrogenase, putative n=1 Tax=Babesia ovis TaxID=5869 RepID=A0A9W5TBD2_BABOV|nr:shikimate dehydrogenase, putative [Babesia ovis]